MNISNVKTSHCELSSLLQTSEHVAKLRINADMKNFQVPTNIKNFVFEHLLQHKILHYAYNPFYLQRVL